jgi:hypothetical protein
MEIIAEVTRVGGFSPIGRLFVWGCFLKTTKGAQILGYVLLPPKSYELSLTKDGFGLAHQKKAIFVPVKRISDNFCD